MSDRAVVALESVLDVGLPVTAEVVLAPLAVAVFLELHATGFDQSRQLAENRCERIWLLDRADEHERPERVDRQAPKREPGWIEVGLALRSGRRSQRAVEVVRPAVV